MSYLTRCCRLMLLCAFVSFSASAATLPVAEWRMDELLWNGTAGEITDSVAANNGQAFSGAVTGAGKICNGGNFAPANSYALINNTLAMEVGKAGGDFSVTYWVRHTNTFTGAWRSLIHKGNTNTDRTFAMWMPPSSNQMHSRISTTSSWNEGINASTAPLALNTWTHVTYVKSGSLLQLYFNGVLDSQATLAGASISNTGPLYLGKDPWYPGFGGQLDEVKIFSGALSAAEIAAGYANENTGKNWDGSARTCPEPPPQPRALYNLEESSWNGTAGEVKDSSGNNRHGAAIGSSLPTPASAIPARAGNPGTCGYGGFPGPANNGGALNLPVNANTTPGAKTSVAFWMYWDGTNSVMPIGWNQHDLWITGANFGFNTAQGDVFGTGSAGLANGWHHVVAVFNNGNVSANKLYIDGSLRVLTQRQGTPANGNAYVNATLRVGGWLANSSYRFSGRIDEVGVYDGELTLSDVNVIYNSTHACAAHVVGEWRMDELTWNGTAGEITDSVAANNGQAFSGAVTGAGKICNGGNFAPANSYALINNTLDMEVGKAGGDFSVAYWVRHTNTFTGAWRSLIHKGNTNNDRTFAMWMYPSSNQMHSRISTTSSWNEGINISTAPLALNTWTHVTYVKSGSLLQLYFNGVLDSQATLAGASISNTGPLYLGKDPWYPGFGGQLDEVKIFSGALSAAEIAAGYANENTGKNWGGSARACPVPAIPIAEYRLEEASWSGTAGEVLDSSGNNRHGTAIGSPLPTPASAIPARAGNPGTCGYGGMPGPSSNGGTFNFPGLPVNTAPDAKTSVAFWMFWDGTNSVMPIGWFGYDLWLTGGHFGFNTGNSDVYGISSAGLASGWHHVVAVFTNGNVAANKLFIDGAAQTLTQRLSTPNNAASVVNSTLRAGGWQRDSNYRFSGRLDEIKVYSGELAPGEVNTVYLATHPCSGLLVPSDFNAFEPVTPAGSVSGAIYTKLAATAFSPDVVALKAGPAVEPGFVGDVKVELVDASGGAVCAARPVIGVPQTITFAALDAGRKAATFTENNAWQNVTARMSYPATGIPTIVACSSDAFAIRPQAFTVTANLGGPTLAAGLNFSMTTASGYSNYTGTPLLDSALMRDHNNAAIGVFSGVFPAALAGNATGSTFQYHDVGTISLLAGAVTDATFTGVDQPNDCVMGSTSNALSGGKYGCIVGSAATGAFGRFYPHHFTYAATLTPACAAGGFTYMDQPALGVNLMLSAKSVNETTTTRYTAGYGTLGTFAVSGDNAGTAVAAARLSSALSAFVWNNGIYTALNTGASFSKSAGPDGPYDSFVLLASVTDPDGAALLGTNSSNTTRIRYGRLRLQNAHGSELLSLPVPFRAEYWNNGWVLNPADSCSGDVSLGAGNAVSVTLTAAPATCVQDSGSPGLSGAGCAAVGPAGQQFKEGGVGGFAGDFNLWLKAPGAGSTGAVTVTGNAPAWLQYPWGGAGAINPTARATFGVYKGANEFIYMRENY